MDSPDMLLLDEPTGDLDTLNTIRIMNLLVELNNMGTTLSSGRGAHSHYSW